MYNLLEKTYHENNWITMLCLHPTADMWADIVLYRYHRRRRIYESWNKRDRWSISSDQTVSLSTTRINRVKPSKLPNPQTKQLLTCQAFKTHVIISDTLSRVQRTSPSPLTRVISATLPKPRTSSSEKTEKREELQTLTINYPSEDSNHTCSSHIGFAISNCFEYWKLQSIFNSISLFLVCLFAINAVLNVEPHILLLLFSSGYVITVPSVSVNMGVEDRVFSCFILQLVFSLLLLCKWILGYHFIATSI